MRSHDMSSIDMKIFRPWTSRRTTDSRFSISSSSSKEEHRRNQRGGGLFSDDIYNYRMSSDDFTLYECSSSSNNNGNSFPPLCSIEDWQSLDYLLSLSSSGSPRQMTMLDISCPGSLLASSYFAYPSAAESIISGVVPKFSSNKRPKKFSCPHCKVSFSNNGQLKGHVRIHTG